MTTTGFDDRILVIEVTGYRQSHHPSSHYTFKVSYRSLARTLQFINRSGGTIVQVRSQTLSLPIENPLPGSTDRVVAELVPASSQETQGATHLEAIAEDLPTPTVDLEASSPSDVKLEISESTRRESTRRESTQGLGVPETEAVSASLPVKSEVAAPPHLLTRFRRWLEKLINKLINLANGGSNPSSQQNLRN